MASKLFGTKIYLLALILSLLQVSKSNGFTGPSESDMPSIITVEGKSIPLQSLKNPIKKSEQTLAEGSKIYITNCALCHGDLLDGKGLYSQSFNPPPANFLHPKSILSRSQSYSYWRIIKGGRGMPESYNPWDSAMPAWEKVLKEDEVWKVIHYIYSKAEEISKPSIQNISTPSIKNGQKLYEDNCSICHGDNGGGDGPGAKISSPFPRNFIKGHIKFRSTPFGKIPTDEDLFKAITNGSNGTTMPSWKHLSENDRHSLVLYLKSLSKKFF